MAATKKDIFADNNKLTKIFSALYGTSSDTLKRQTSRYKNVAESYAKYFGNLDIEFFSCPGRAEITGNHTDHNGGKILTASINLDMIAAAAPSYENKIVIHSESYDNEFSVDLNDLIPREEESTNPLIRGIAAGFQRKGFNLGGFTAYVTSDIANGSGISSSAAIEMLIATVLNSFYNNNEIPIPELAKIGQYAENHYWRKPSGLLDQMACGTGGLIHLDFKDAENPRVTPVKYNFESESYRFLVVHTGGDHSKLSGKYAQIPVDMWAVAKELGAEKLCDVSFGIFLEKLPALRAKLGDRAVLRAMHFYTENARVDAQVSALGRGDFDAFLNYITESGMSSWGVLQNCYDSLTPDSQDIPIALSLTEYFLKSHGAHGAYRVHGGGFAGVVLVVMKEELVKEYTRFVEPYFGKDAAMVLSIRDFGAVNVSNLICGK